MDLTARPVDIGTRTPDVLLHASDAAELGTHPLERVRVQHDGRATTGIVAVTEELVDPGTLGVTRPLGHITGEVSVTLAPTPESVRLVKKKLDDVELEAAELRTVVGDVANRRLSDLELSAFVAAVYANGLSRGEMTDLTACMVDAGKRIEWDRSPVADKHSIGGVAGNRVTPVVVPIVAAAGLLIPKTSSRAVTSAAGTADTMEVFCEVSFDLAELREIVAGTGGCMVWGGAVDLSPVDDEIIRAETPLSIDPPGQVVASVLSKKQSAGATHVVVDIPYGEGAKVESLEAARELAEDFRHVGDTLGLTVQCAITRGEAPIGTGVGPVLEAREVLAVLEGEGPADLRGKSLRLAESLLDLCDSDADAAELLDSGAALETFRAIVAAQNGDPDVERADLIPGSHTATVTADHEGVVTHVDNHAVNGLARRAGAPRDVGAGLALHATVGDEVTAGDRLFTLHAERPAKLDEARAWADGTESVRVRPRGETLVERV